jgi:hypothetical protein
MIRSFLHLAIFDPEIANSENIPQDLKEIIYTIAKDKNVVFCKNKFLNKSNGSKFLQQVIFNSLNQNGLVVDIPQLEGGDLNNILHNLPRDLPTLVISKRKIASPTFNWVNYLKAHSDDDKYNCFVRRIPIKIPQNNLVDEIIKMIKVLKFAGNSGPFRISFLDPYLNEEFVYKITKMKLFELADIEFLFCRPNNLSSRYIQDNFMGTQIPEHGDSGLGIYQKFNNWLKNEAKKTLRDLQASLSRRYLGDQLQLRELLQSRIIFKYYYIKHEKYSKQADQNASEYAFTDLKSIWHHRAFKIQAGDNNLFCNSYESAHSFIYPGQQIHDASEPLHFRLISNREFGSVLNQDVWDSPYIMNIQGPIQV